jgi:hypothetical protein
MHEHVFGDESKASGFRLAAVAVAPADLPEMRRVVRGLKLPGQGRLHCTRESDGHRKQMIKAFQAAGVTAVIYDASAIRDEKTARDMTITRLADDAAAMNADRLVLELDDSVAAADRIIIRQRLLKAGMHHTLRYHHARAREECLLSIPDALVWCYAKGNHWRRLVLPLIRDVVPVN